jgi:hypothetical protein
LHVPQFKTSVCRSTHALSQLVSCAGHEALQAPFEQTGLAAGHTAPQPPQLLGSLWVAVQMPLHRKPPFAHAHSPFKQVVPLEQSASQPPQFTLSVCRSTHALPQRFCPAGHGAQTPPEQPNPAGHALPQPPQLSTSSCVSTHPAGDAGQ